MTKHVLFRHSGFVIDSDFGFRHSDFLASIFRNKYISPW